MNPRRRQLLLHFSAYCLCACSGVQTGAQTGNVRAQGPSSSRRPDVDASELPSDLVPRERADFLAWLDQFRPRAAAVGILPETLDRGLLGAGYVPGVITRDRTQIQTRRTFEEYLSIATSDERLAKGRMAIARFGPVLQAIETRYGVDQHIIAAIWGMESQFGEKRGLVPVISATATLAFEGRRAAFYEDQLLAALRILQRGEVEPSRLTGSWAGAMGHTQFIPTSYLAYAVDFTNDGRRDIWADDPSDALASTASYLARNGWRRELIWGSEAGTSDVVGRVIEPQPDGVRFTVTHNFNVLKTYNNSDFYALAIGHLADRLAGAGPLRGSFPPDANGLTRADRLAVQNALAARGYDVGTIDGVIGPLTEAAIADFERRAGLPVTGRANRELLLRLR